VCLTCNEKFTPLLLTDEAKCLILIIKWALVTVSCFRSFLFSFVLCGEKSRRNSALFLYGLAIGKQSAGVALGAATVQRKI
jgi:hypothetical protein